MARNTDMRWTTEDNEFLLSMSNEASDLHGVSKLLGKSTQDCFEQLNKLKKQHAKTNGDEKLHTRGREEKEKLAETTVGKSKKATIEREITLGIVCPPNVAADLTLFSHIKEKTQVTVCKSEDAAGTVFLTLTCIQALGHRSMEKAASILLPLCCSCQSDGGGIVVELVVMDKTFLREGLFSGGIWYSPSKASISLSLSQDYSTIKVSGPKSSVYSTFHLLVSLMTDHPFKPSHQKSTS